MSDAVPHALSAATSARHELDRLLAREAPTLAGTLPDGFADLTERYVALLLEANARLNLTRIVAPEHVARLHLLDALSALPTLDRIAPARALDVGCGGGVPGIILAIARPAVSWTLVDSVGKKADAIRGFVDALDLANVTVVAERAENLGRDAAYRESFDLVTARACASLPVLAEYALPLLTTGGSLLAWKGLVAPDELAAGDAAADGLGGARARTVPAGIPALGDHRFVVVEKLRPTPAAYPRRAGEPTRRPLA